MKKSRSDSLRRECAPSGSINGNQGGFMRQMIYRTALNLGVCRINIERFCAPNMKYHLKSFEEAVMDFSCSIGLDAVNSDFGITPSNIRRFGEQEVEAAMEKAYGQIESIVDGS